MKKKEGNIEGAKRRSMYCRQGQKKMKNTWEKMKVWNVHGEYEMNMEWVVWNVGGIRSMQFYEISPVVNSCSRFIRKQAFENFHLLLVL